MMEELEDTQSDAFDAPDSFNATATTATQWAHENEAAGRIDESDSPNRPTDRPTNRRSGHPTQTSNRLTDTANGL